MAVRLQHCRKLVSLQGLIKDDFMDTEKKVVMPLKFIQFHNAFNLPNTLPDWMYQAGYKKKKRRLILFKSQGKPLLRNK